MRETFSNIYRKNLWGDGSLENPLSGDGSNPTTAKPYVDFVKKSIQEFSIQSVLDIGHGDWAMWKDFDFAGVDYTGVDVADNISNELDIRFGNNTRRFRQIGDDENFPKAQMLITKEVLQHLSNSQVSSILDRIYDFEVLIICNGYYPKRLLFVQLLNWLQPRTRFKKLIRGESPLYRESFPINNRDILTGDFRGIDLSKKPFSKINDRYSMIGSFTYRGRSGSGVVHKVYLFKRSEKN